MMKGLPAQISACGEHGSPPSGMFLHSRAALVRLPCLIGLVGIGVWRGGCAPNSAVVVDSNRDSTAPCSYVISSWSIENSVFEQ